MKPQFNIFYQNGIEGLKKEKYIFFGKYTSSMAYVYDDINKIDCRMDLTSLARLRVPRGGSTARTRDTTPWCCPRQGTSFLRRLYVKECLTQ